MRRYVRGFAILGAGLLLGLPVGYVIRGNKPQTNTLAGDKLQLTFNRDYFANLPAIADGESARQINVGTFYFDADGDGKPDSDSALTVPLVETNGTGR